MFYLLIIITLVVVLIWWVGEKGILQQLSKFDLTTWFSVIAQTLILSLNLGLLVWKISAKIPQQYNDFISGNLGFNNTNKSSELYALYISVVAFILILILILKLYDNMYNDVEFRQGAVKLSFYCLVPSAILIGQSLRINNTSKLFIFSAGIVGLSLAITFILHFLYRKGHLKQNEAFVIGSKILLGILFLGLSELGFSVFLSRIGILSRKPGLISSLIISIYAAILFVYKKRNIALKRKLDLGVALSQIGLPFLFLILASPPVILSDGTRTFFPYNPILNVILIILCMISYASIYKYYKKGEGAEKNLSISISPLLLLAILVYLQSALVGWPSILTDEYHSGEFYLPWWQFKHFGYLPFLDYQPARGLVNYVPGLLSQLFYDGSFSGQIMVINHFISFYISLTFLSMRSITGDFVAFLLAFSLFDFVKTPSGGVVVAIACLAILYKAISNSSEDSSIKSLWLWVGISFFTVFFMVAEGGVFVFGTLPLGFWLLIKAYQNSKKKLLISIGILILIIFILALTTDFVEVVISLLRYLVEQAGVNEVAHGVTWYFPANIKDMVTYGYFWQFIRFSWLLLIIPIVVSLIKHGTDLSKRNYTFILIALLVMSVLIIPRAAGRIGAQAYSRPGLVSIGFIICGLPLVVLPVVKNQFQKAFMILSMALVFGLIGNQEATLNTAWDLHRQVVFEPSETVRGSSHGLENIGEQAIMDDDQLLRQVNIKQVLDLILDPHETYYDATNHNADYGFQGRPSPVVDTAFYNSPTEQQQLRAIERLRLAEIPLALIKSDNKLFDGGPLSLRAFWIYRFLLDDYVPFKDANGYIWMVRKEESNRITSAGFQLGTESEQLDLLSEVFWQQDLYALPTSWGESIKQLEEKIENPVDLLETGIILMTNNMQQDDGGVWDVFGTDPYFVIEIPEGIKGDMLYLETNQKVEGSSLQVFWINDIIQNFNAKNSFKFKANASHYMIPLSSAPSWEFSGATQQIRIDLPNNLRGKVSFNQIILFNRTIP